VLIQSKQTTGNAPLYDALPTDVPIPLFAEGVGSLMHNEVECERNMR
jgi:hypothetical protein